MATTATRLGALGMLTALVVAACSGGFGGASPTAAPASQPASAPAGSTAPSAVPSEAAAPVTLTYFVDDNNVTAARLQGLIDAYTALHPNVTIEIETHPGGTEGDNLVKTRLATGDMPDIFYYNSGSLLQALNPSDTLVDLSDEPFIANIQESYLPTVSANGGIYGVPTEGTLGGGILYNKKIYSDLGLTVPKTWAEFAANNETIKAAGNAAAVCATYGDTWTSQLFVLADYYNVQKAAPDFAEKYTANEAHYADTPGGAGRLPAPPGGVRQGLVPGGLRGGQVRQRARSSWPPAQVRPLPDADVRGRHDGRELPRHDRRHRVLRPAGRRRRDERRDDLDARRDLHPEDHRGRAARRGQGVPGLHRSVEGTEAMSAGVAPSGPYVIKGSTLPDDVPGAIKDIQPYIDGGNNLPALEFLSPVKGPSLEQITVAVGSGLNTAEEARQAVRPGRREAGQAARAAGLVDIRPAGGIR